MMIRKRDKDSSSGLESDELEVKIIFILYFCLLKTIFV